MKQEEQNVGEVIVQNASTTIERTSEQKAQTKKLKCKRCGSENVTVQNTEKNHYKQGHGCIWFICFGIWYFIWIGIKWMYKWFIYICYWVFAGWEYAIYCKIRGKNRVTPKYIRNLMRKRGKMYSDTVTHVVCQDCGFSYEL